MLPICRTCLQKISDINFVSLSDGTQSLQIKSELTLCVPEMVLDLVAEPVMCGSCVGALHSAYDFKRQCLQAEERIQNYMQKNVDLNTNLVDLNNVCDLESNTEEKTKTKCEMDFGELEMVLDQHNSNRLGLENAENIKEELQSSDEEVQSEDYKITLECLENLMEYQENVTVSNNCETAAQLKKEDSQDECDNSDVGELSAGNSEDDQNAEKPYRCVKCDYRCAAKSKLKRHVLTHSSIRPFKCLLCNFNARRKETLTIHMREHSGERPYKCSFCEFSAVSKYALSKHRMQTHGEEKPHKCPECKYTTVRESTLQRHMAVHSNDKPFKCDQCNFSTAWKSTWATHMQGHSGMTYKCDLCDYSTIYKHNLSLHLGRHRGDKPFQCSKCEYKAADKSKLKIHVLTHGNVKPFICGICNFGTTRIDTLRKHMGGHERNDSTELSLH